jgi:hypothetical protein
MKILPALLLSAAVGLPSFVPMGCSAGSATANAGSCVSDALPAAGTTCVVPGTYDVTFALACPNVCAVTATASTAVHTYTVEVNGNGVRLTEPSTFAGGGCQLSGCDCTPLAGESRLHVVFTPTGFLADGEDLSLTNDGGGCTSTHRWTGTKR